ncbi:MAG: hypothetical protein K0Q94_3578 [Paenibacillus sp.]|nr:hypothetical protein [Paenibacillus sp.]
MSSHDKSFLKLMFKLVKKESGIFAEKFADAARGGADVAGKQILEAAGDLKQPSEVVLGKLITALKGGVHKAGEDIVTAGLDLVKGVSSSEDTSESSKSKSSKSKSSKSKK